MIHLAQFSGGKDSTALLLYLLEARIPYTAVFCDTGWEHDITYSYVEQINQQLLGGKLVRLKSAKYTGFVDLCLQRKMVPGQRTRFCTEELKVFPLHRYIESLDDEVTTYIGIRGDESMARARDGGQSRWIDAAGGYRQERPLFDWTAQDCFSLMRRHNVQPNPLYLMGMKRVGCWPCIFTSHRELLTSIRADPGIKDRLRALEKELNETVQIDGSPRTFFRGDYIPQRFCSVDVKSKSGEFMRVPSCDDVFRYLESVDENQLPLFPPPKCLSVYNLCE